MLNRITYKLIIAVCGTTVAIVAMFSYLIIKSQQSALLLQVEHNANQLSETVKSGTKYDMLFNYRERIHRTIDTIAEQEGIQRIRIFNKEGSIIYSSDKSETGSMVNKRAESCYACHAADQPLHNVSIKDRTRTFVDETGHYTFGIINPIYNEPGCWQADCHAHSEAQNVLGVLDVTLSLDEVEAQLDANRWRLTALAISAILAISLLLAILVHRFVGKPVNELVRATVAVAKGDLKYKIPIDKKDELGELARSFNKMTENLAEAQRQLYQSDKLASLGRLAAGVAHEINNPLTGVLTYSSFLLKRHNGEAETKADLEVIVRETKRCREIVKGLLDFARQAPSKKTEVDLNEVIRQTANMLDNQLNLKNISLELDLTPDLGTLRADSIQIEQVLVNLIVNAADAIGKQGGKINITTRNQRADGEDKILLQIEDTGSGISEKNLARIFDPFYSTKGQKGTGLGLAVVWGIIEKHGGKIDVKSKEGVGTTFTIELPVKKGTSLLVEEA